MPLVENGVVVVILDYICDIHDIWMVSAMYARNSNSDELLCSNSVHATYTVYVVFAIQIPYLSIIAFYFLEMTCGNGMKFTHLLCAADCSSEQLDENEVR